MTEVSEVFDPVSLGKYSPLSSIIDKAYCLAHWLLNGDGENPFLGEEIELVVSRSIIPTPSLQIERTGHDSMDRVDDDSDSY